MGAKPREKFLFHGSRNVPPDAIYKSEEGFDLRLAKSQAMWGQAIYFARNANYSHNYSHPTTNGSR